MGRGINLGRLFGIKIRVDWSWLLIFLLVTWNISTAFGSLHEEWSIALRWGMGVLSAVLFFASVLAHELAHSLVAQAQGVPVRSITLFLFGGVSDIQEEPKSPGNEFVMAILGPLTSLVIGGILLLITGLTAGMQQTNMQDAQQLVGQLGPFVTMLTWLGSINVILGVFNLIPGFPLDGGRILRSIFWAISGSLRKSTRWASWVGQGIAWLMITAGIAMSFGAQIPLLGSGLGSGLWLAFIGWFLNNAASRSYRRVVVQDVLEGVSVSRMMRSNPPTVAPDISVNALIDEYIMNTDDQGFPVVENDELVGLVTLDDVRSTTREVRGNQTVRDIMTSVEELSTISSDGDAGDALMQLARRDIRQLPVIDENNQLQGLVRRRDIVKWLQLHSDMNV